MSTAIQIEAENSATYAHRNLYQAIEYLHICQNHSLADLIALVVEMMEEIAIAKRSSIIVRTKAIQGSTDDNQAEAI